MTTAADPLSSKLLLALLGAVFGWVLKAGWDEVQLRRRWRRLGPLIVRQLGGAAAQCAQAFDAAVLPRIAAKLGSAHSSAIEMVAAGVSSPQWLEGLVHLSDTMDVLQAAEAAHASHKGDAMERLRQQGERLRAATAQLASG